MQSYSDKAAGYFGYVRRDIEPYLPPHSKRVFEVGCGTGATLAWLKQTGRCSETTGLELFETAAKTAVDQVDRVLHSDVERTTLPADIGTFDLLLCLDVLEHLVEPWAVLSRLVQLLNPGGRAIVSLPNVRSIDVTIDLLVKGRWSYKNDGIMDRTHLRFFTRGGGRDLLEQSGLAVEASKAIVRDTGKRGVLHRATGTVLEEFLATQYIHCGVRR